MVMTTYKIAYNGPHGAIQFTVCSEMFDVQRNADMLWIWDSGALMAVIPAWRLISIEKIG